MKEDSCANIGGLYMEGPYLNNGKIYVIPIHANRFSFRAVFELQQ